MKRFQKLLLQELQANYWEVVEKVVGEQWWELEHWHIASTRKPHELWISFISIYSEGSETSVDEIRASIVKPTGRLESAETVTEMWMAKGLFNDKLTVFVSSLNDHRKLGNVANVENL